MKYIVEDIPRAPYGDHFEEEYETLEEAIENAERQWGHLTDLDKKKRTVYVLESINPDEEAQDHFDGDILWRDGLPLNGKYRIISQTKNLVNLDRRQVKRHAGHMRTYAVMPKTFRCARTNSFKLILQTIRIAKA